jgi:hypothetical protein
MFCPIAGGKWRRDRLGMKLKLLLCGAALMVAGCASPQNPFASSGEYSYTYDYVPQPVPEIPTDELAKIYQEQATVSFAPPSGAVGLEYSGR